MLHFGGHFVGNSLKVKVNLTQLCSTLCNPMDYSPPGSSVHGILQARILEWVAIAFSRDLPNPGFEPRSPALQADSLPTELPGKLTCTLIIHVSSVVSDSLQTHGLLCPWNFLGKNTGAGYHFLLQGLLPTQGLNPCLLCLLH